MNIQKSTIIITVLALLLPKLCLAAPKISMDIKAEKEVTTIEKNKKKTIIVSAKDATPGEIVTYKISYSNEGDEPATDVIITNPIPDGTAYVTGSATKIDLVSFSIDNGSTFKQPSLLTYTVKNQDGTTQKKTATPEQYTDVRWIIQKIHQGEKGTVSYSVKIK